MTLTFVTNFAHHHQLPVADEFYRLLGDEYHYIATAPLSEMLKQGGYESNIKREYLIYSYRSLEEMHMARKLIDESDVVIIGAAPIEWVIKRQKENKVTFHYSERWLKNNIWKNFLPWNLWDIWKSYGRYRNKRVYMLCASAFTAHDVKMFDCFPHKCFKWGYFTSVDESYKVPDWNEQAAIEEIKFMWCARFLNWKHPELPVYLAQRLKKRGCRFVINMYGSGGLFETTKGLARELEVEDVINFCGNVPNDQILDKMRLHDIFLFTSDRNEGWGAVLNEAMSNGCAVVASDEIGSVPFLIEGGENGLVFKSKSIDSLERNVIALIDDAEYRQRIRNSAVHTMQHLWTPSCAASAFLELAKIVLDNKLNNYNNYEGPASWA